MKKSIFLAGLFLCSAGVFAADTRTDLAEGKKRNEEAYERMLEKTGWKNDKSTLDEKQPTQGAHRNVLQSNQPKSS